MVRVLHVVTHMEMGGLETMLMNYYRHIDGSVLQFDFLTHRPYDGIYGEEIAGLGGKIYHLPTLNPFSPKYLKKLDLFFTEHPEYKIVHAHQDCLSSVILKKAKKNNVPVRIAHSHSSNLDKNWKYPIKLYYRRFVPEYATELYACGKEAGKWMFGDAEFGIIHNVIDAKRYIYNSDVRTAVRKKLGVPEDCILVGNVGRFSPPKNHHRLIKIYSELVKQRNSKLVLVGDGGLRESVRKEVGNLELLDNVIFTGIRKDVPELLWAMDVVVMPSHYEGLSLATIEAQAAGLPLIISDKISIECKKTDLVYQVPLSEPDDAWADKIIEVAGTPRRCTYNEIAEAGYDAETSAKRLQNMYISKYEQATG